MTVWPYKPLTPLQETLSWLTDIIMTYEGEQRIALRDVPRRVFNFDHLLNAQAAFGARAIYRETLDYQIPDWTQTDVATIAAGLSVSVAITSPYYESGGAALIWVDSDTFEVVQVDSVASDGGSIVLAEVLTSVNNAFIMPLYNGLSTAQFSAAVNAGGFIRSSFQATVYSSAEISASNYPQYKGHDVMDFCPNVASGSLDTFIVWPYVVVDNETSTPEQFKERSRLDNVFFVRWQAFNDADQNELRQWLYSRKGRQKAFWLPSWLNDLPLQQSIGSAATVITTALPSAEVALLNTLDIEIKTSSAVYRREVTSMNITGGGLLELTIDAPLGVNVAIGSVERISILRCVRFNVDSFDLQHAARAGFTVSIPTIEIPLP